VKFYDKNGILLHCALISLYWYICKTVRCALAAVFVNSCYTGSGRVLVLVYCGTVFESQSFLSLLITTEVQKIRNFRIRQSLPFQSTAIQDSFGTVLEACLPLFLAFIYVITLSTADQFVDQFS